jgi:hypothetical protein
MLQHPDRHDEWAHLDNPRSHPQRSLSTSKIRTPGLEFCLAAKASSDPTPAWHRISRRCPPQALVELSLLAAAYPKSVLGIFRSTKDAHILHEPGTIVPRR